MSKSKRLLWLILLKDGSSWRNLYPPKDGESPPTYQDEIGAVLHAEHLTDVFGVVCRVAPIDEALTFPTPRRW